MDSETETEADELETTKNRFLNPELLVEGRTTTTYCVGEGRRCHRGRRNLHLKGVDCRDHSCTAREVISEELGS